MRPTMLAISTSLAHAQIRKCVLQSRKCILENRARRSKIEAQPGFSAWSKLLAGAGKDAGALLDSVGNLLGRQMGSRKIDPCEIGGVEAHRACAGNCGLNARIEQVAALGEIRQQVIEPHFTRTPSRLRRDHAESVVGTK